MDTSGTDSFANDPVSPSAMPDYRDLAFERVARTFRRYTLISSLVIWAPLLLAPLIMRAVGNVPALLAEILGGVIVAFAIGVALYRWFDAGFRGWALREHDLAARRGIFWRTLTVLPIARIQHVETTSGPLERSHGLARLKLYTAGGMTADLTVIGLNHETADRLREHLVEQIRLRDAGAEPGASGGEDQGPDDAEAHELA